MEIVCITNLSNIFKFFRVLLNNKCRIYTDIMLNKVDLATVVDQLSSFGCNFNK